MAKLDSHYRGKKSRLLCCSLLARRPSKVRCCSASRNRGEWRGTVHSPGICPCAPVSRSPFNVSVLALWMCGTRTCRHPRTDRERNRRRRETDHARYPREGRARRNPFRRSSVHALRTAILPTAEGLDSAIAPAPFLLARPEEGYYNCNNMEGAQWSNSKSANSATRWGS